jgi:hypothetical protein
LCLKWIVVVEWERKRGGGVRIERRGGGSILWFHGKFFICYKFGFFAPERVRERELTGRF